MLSSVAGKLFVVATPLGNLDDLSPRAFATLREVALVLCEDTRRTSGLLARHGIQAKLLSCHRFNERRRLDAVLERLRSGLQVALVSDSGTPGVSDPGALIVRAALDAGIPVSPVPGPSAAAALLSVSGLSANRYVFEGFLPHRAGERRRRLRTLHDEPRTIVFFETPQRVLDTLQDIEQVLGPRRTVVGRELTKLHEAILQGSPAEVAAALGQEVRGEITIAVEGARPGELAHDAAAGRVRTVWREALERSAGDRRLALRHAARELGLGRAELQRRLAELGADPSGGRR
jgi:16S rRNA (cytidine1402-2'-O)-methyltransferase